MGCIASKQPRDLSPPINPPKQKKKDAVPPPEKFAAIDKRALKAPVSVCSSVKTLSKYLVKRCRNDMEKVRSFYRWITDNISYDSDGFFSDNSGPQDGDAVLQRRTGVCEGYATLFSALCSEAGIPCKKVSGFSKGYGYDPEIAFSMNTKTNHAWNIVYINGQWRPVESTWGAGHLNSQNKFEKCFEELYFLTDPKDFIIEHFPVVDKDIDASLKLQLLKNLVSLVKFNTAICPSIKGIEWGFESASHSTQIITVDKECEITFTTRNVALQDVSCHLIEKSTRKDFKRYVLLRKVGDSFVAKVTPPFDGKYVLELYGKPVRSSGSTYDALVSFVISCKSTLKDVRPYPEKSGTWGPDADSKRYGFTEDIFRYDVISSKNGETEIRMKTDKKASVSLRLVHAEKTESDLKSFVFGSYEESTLVIKVRLPYAGYYSLALFAKDPHKQTTSFYEIAQFLIDNKKPLNNAQPFPEAYTITQDYGCVLFEPLIGALSANQDVRLRLRSDQVIRVMINKHLYNKGENNEFDITFKTPDSGETFVVYGSPTKEGNLDGLYVFDVV